MRRLTNQQRIAELEERLRLQGVRADEAERAASAARRLRETDLAAVEARAGRVTAWIWWAPAGTMSDRPGYVFDLTAGNRVLVASSTRTWPTPGQAKRAARAVSPGCTVKMPPRRKAGA